MKSLFIHGCYDIETFNTLLDFSSVQVSFDLRGRSSNLIPFGVLSELLKVKKPSTVYLTFENDKKETILSFLNLLKDVQAEIVLIFRDQLPAAFYHNLNHPFIWMFHPEADWRGILDLPKLSGVLLPMSHQKFYKETPELWNRLESKALDVYIHAHNFSEAASVQLQVGVKLSVDLTTEVEKGFRSVDQERLRTMKLWRSYENTAF